VDCLIGELATNGELIDRARDVAADANGNVFYN
jgi:hypothetical protein